MLLLQLLLWRPETAAAAPHEPVTLVSSAHEFISAFAEGVPHIQIVRHLNLSEVKDSYPVPSYLDQVVKPHATVKTVQVSLLHGEVCLSR